MSTSISEHARQEEEISPEARDAAVDEIYSYEDGGRPQGYHVQQAIDSATAAKEREIEELKKKVGRDEDRIAHWKKVGMTVEQALEYAALCEREKLHLDFEWQEEFEQLEKSRDALQARVRELQESLAWTLDHLDEGVEKIHHRKVTDCRQTLQP